MKRDIITVYIVPDNFIIRSKREVKTMPITYNKLWKLLIDLDMSKTQLKEKAKVSSNVIAKMGKNEPVSIDTLVKICSVLNVDIGDVLSISSE